MKVADRYSTSDIKNASFYRCRIVTIDGDHYVVAETNICRVTFTTHSRGLRLLDCPQHLEQNSEIIATLALRAARMWRAYKTENDL